MKPTFSYWLVTVAVALVGAAMPASHAYADAGVHKVVIQVSDNDPKRWSLALNNAQNVQDDFGRDKVRIEIVAYGPGIDMLKFESVVGPRVDEVIHSGIRVAACQTTMRNQHLSKDDMLPNLTYVKSGVPELMKRQEQGYSYIRP